MKKIFIILISFIIITKVDAQTKTLLQLKTDSTGNKVIQCLRDHQPDSIYLMAGKTFKQNISQENFKSISENQLFPINDFKNVVFVKTENGINKYKVSGNPELQLLVGLDAKYEIETLLIQPYSED